MKKSEAIAVIYLSYLRKPDADQKELSRLGREMLHKLLSHVGENADELEIKKGVNGRPYFDNCERLDFSISHSNELVVCALSVEEGKVGVDTEKTESTIRKEKQPLFAGRFFSGNEREILAKEPERFSEIWTRKEAYLKWVGTGIATDLREVDTCRIPKQLRFESVFAEEHVITVCLSAEAKVEII
jgi:4'-phosphopantetheinyl transferase